ncbi:nitrous oxide reductase accessory protein NosL [Castellaniella sp.]|uniref:nitrous oxide reductase accessory protein NosL n=1 Tax=Castellaniella sp. TaxID=1955812 RepID=UPI00355D9CB6
MRHRLVTRRLLAAGATGLVALLLASCSDQGTGSPPPAPSAMTDDAIGHYCGMFLVEHIGPKGQILLRDQKQPVWFSTIREVFAYTLLPEEPKTIVAIYVQDMGRAGVDGNPPDEAWIDARSAHYVIESDTVGAMGAPDALPFEHLEQAQAFVRDHGGRVLGFEDMPEDYVLRYVEPVAADRPAAPQPAGVPPS